MYQGEEVEANRQSIIRCDERTSGGGIIGIVRVDGKTTTDFFTYGFHGGKWAGEVSVLPGKHSIVARIEYPFSHAMAYLWLVAEAGESYVIKARSEGFSVRMWIENERTAQLTGGITGSDDEPKEN